MTASGDILHSLRLSQHERAFHDNGIESSEDIQLLTQEDFSELGIVKLGEQKRLLKWINDQNMISSRHTRQTLHSSVPNFIVEDDSIVSFDTLRSSSNFSSSNNTKNKKKKKRNSSFPLNILSHARSMVGQKRLEDAPVTINVNVKLKNRKDGPLVITRGHPRGDSVTYMSRSTTAFDDRSEVSTRSSSQYSSSPRRTPSYNRSPRSVAYSPTSSPRGDGSSRKSMPIMISQLTISPRSTSSRSSRHRAFGDDATLGSRSSTRSNRRSSRQSITRSSSSSTSQRRGGGGGATTTRPLYAYNNNPHENNNDSVSHCSQTTTTTTTLDYYQESTIQQLEQYITESKFNTLGSAAASVNAEDCTDPTCKSVYEFLTLDMKLVKHLCKKYCMIWLEGTALDDVQKEVIINHAVEDFKKTCHYYSHENAVNLCHCTVPESVAAKRLHEFRRGALVLSCRNSVDIGAERLLSSSLDDDYVGGGYNDDYKEKYVARDITGEHEISPEEAYKSMRGFWEGVCSFKKPDSFQATEVEEKREEE